MTANNFTPGQQVIVDGTLYTFKHYATGQGNPPRKAHAHARHPAHCSYAVVNLPGSEHPILVRRESLKTPSDVAVDTMASKSSAAVVVKSDQIRPPTKTPSGLDIIKADALDAQAERLEGYAKSLRSEAQALRSTTW